MPQEHACDVCGSTQAVEVPNIRLYTKDQPIHICRCCGFVHVKLRRSSQEVADSWSDDVYGDGYTARIPAVLARQTYVADYMDIKLCLQDKKILDIGAGEAQFLEIIRRTYGATPYGIEPSKRFCKSMKDNGFDCFHGTAENYATSNDDKSFDIVTILWTLETCSSCKDMLTVAYDSLKDEGHLVVATGSRILVPFKKNIHHLFNSKPEDPDYYEPVDNHPFHFSANTLRALLAVSGFQTTAINRYHDTDYLVVIARKVSKDTKIPWQGDNWLAVHNFFERWHKESTYHITQLTD